MNKRQSVLLIFGGESSEHNISIRSAQNVYAAIDNSRYEVKLCYIDPKGVWWLLKGWQQSLDTVDGEQLSIVPGGKEFRILPGNAPLYVDVLLPILHGENGHEDGMIQGIAQVMHIPVVGSGIGASAVCWDKLYTKQLLQANNIAITPFIAVSSHDQMPQYSEVIQQLGEVIFVKPTIAGSSIGVSKVINESEYITALKEAFKHSSRVLIEKAIIGRELEVAVLGNPPNHRVSGVGEIIPGDDFYSFEEKYSSTSKAQVVVNASIDQTLKEKIQHTAHRAYDVIGCKGLARVDFLLDNGGELYVNEFNTLPGFTSISQYPKLWEQQGIAYDELINRIISYATE